MLSGALAGVTGAVPFSVAELLVAGVLAWALARGARAVVRIRRGRRPPGTRALEGLLRAGAVAGPGYASFLLLWGLNYQRLPFAATAGFDTSPATVPELSQVTEALVASANGLRAPLSEDERGVMRLGDKTEALARTEAGFRAAARLNPALDGPAARPKAILSSPVFSRLGISGIYFPFTAEANVNADVPAPEMPFSASHEVAHLRGFAREDEASYLGYLACRLHPDPDFRYSGALVASLYASQALAAVDPEGSRRLERQRSAAVRRDVEAIRAWVERHRGPAMAMSERVNNAYLRSQGQKEGVRSYGRMVDLLIAERRAER